MTKKKIDGFRYGMGYLAGRTILNLVIATLLSMVLCVAIKGLFEDAWWSLLLMGVICLLLNGGMVYQFMWIQGDKEANYIQLGRMEKQRYKGLQVGLLAVIPYGVLDVILGLSLLRALPFDFLRAFRILNAPLYGFMKLLHRGPGWPTETMEGLSAGGFAGLALMPLVYVLFCALGYELGLRRISIGERLVYKQSKDSKDDR